MDSYSFSKAIFKILKSPSLQWKLRKAFPTVFFNPKMTQDEYLLFKKLCIDKKVFLEYGSGGSTIYLLKNNKDVFSVESNPDFYKYMRAIGLIKRSIDRKLEYKFIDLGPTNRLGKPLSSENSTNWSAYYSSIWQDIDPVKYKVDIVFVDGRFRVCCCLFSILKIVEYNWKNTLILIHDFWSREEYHIVLKFLQEVKSSANLVCFEVKEDINTEEVKETIREYAFVIR